jgi:hypothetical protein
VALFSLTGLEKVLDFVGDNFAIFCGQSIGDLLIISLDKCVHFCTLALTRASINILFSQFR